MRHVGIREFKTQATTMLASGETLVIERRGTPIGFFLPIEAKDRNAGREALDRLGETVTGILDRLGIDEDELVGEIAAPFRRE
jgi:antitoxin (DNA-binding transcriptional repressor) of toxin-antitoxin stability system